MGEILQDWKDNFSFESRTRSVQEIVERERKLSEDLVVYENTWVGVYDSEVVANDENLDGLLEKLSSRQYEAIFYVHPAHDGADFFLEHAA